MNYLLGGGFDPGFIERSVRSGVRILVYTYLFPYKHTGLIMVGLQPPTPADETIKILKTMRRMADQGLTQTELDDAKTVSQVLIRSGSRPAAKLRRR